MFCLGCMARSSFINLIRLGRTLQTLHTTIRCFGRYMNLDRSHSHFSKSDKTYIINMRLLLLKLSDLNEQALSLSLSLFRLLRLSPSPFLPLSPPSASLPLSRSPFPVSYSYINLLTSSKFNLSTRLPCLSSSSYWQVCYYQQHEDFHMT